MDSSTNAGRILRAKDILRKPFTAEFLRYLIPGILVGIVTGLVVSTFRWLIDQTLILLTIVYPYLGNHPVMIIPYVLGTLIVAWLIAKIIRPEMFDVVGSGVPQIEAILIGKHEMNWWSVLWRKFISGLLTICPGLFLGREGPCIQIGACIGQGLAKDVYHYQNIEERNLLIKCGIAAGLSAAFSAPVAATVFLLEEVTRHFNFKVIVGALAAAISADLMTIFFFGTKPCLAMPLSMRLPLSSYSWLILVGIIIGMGGYLFQYGMLNLNWWYRKFTILPRYYHSILPLLLVIPVGLWNSHILGGSHNLIMYITNMSLKANWLLVVGTLIIFFILRYTGTMIAAGASVPGGIFMPIFVLGSILGAIAGIVMIHFGIIPASCYLNLIVMGMAAYFGATEGTPISAILLVTEMVGSVDQILPMTILTFVAYFTSMTLGARNSIYEALRTEMLSKKG